MATLTPHDVRRLAVEAECSPDTVARFLSRLPVQPSIRARLERATQRLTLAIEPMDPTVPTGSPFIHTR
ncbi:MAG: hypothetical protein EOO70_05635 [Myxococcaceae bacterium]|nr:MAG: hypothetical protein EOO70_05635 [Myxococcaceae bacterium]